MFDNYPPGISPNNNPSNQPPVDMYAGINSNPTQANNLPPVVAAPNQYNPGQALPNQPYVTPSNNSSVKFLIIGLVTLVVVLAGAFAVYQMVLKPKLENNIQTVAQTPVSEEIIEDPLFDNQTVTSSDTLFIDGSASSTVTSSLPETVTSTTSSVPIVQPAEIDSDMDGLNDSLETLKGTNKNLADTDIDGLNDGDEVLKYAVDPLKADTDGDGLNDGDEVLKYTTDPLKTDTDGDTYLDGEEVKNGYNPLGAGRLVMPIK